MGGVSPPPPPRHTMGHTFWTRLLGNNEAAQVQARRRPSPQIKICPRSEESNTAPAWGGRGGAEVLFSFFSPV